LESIKKTAKDNQMSMSKLLRETALAQGTFFQVRTLQHLVRQMVVKLHQVQRLHASGQANSPRLEPLIQEFAELLGEIEAEINLLASAHDRKHDRH
jgi:uncharacterized protein involved in exopolysaccharide biosynthesis